MESIQQIFENFMHECAGLDITEGLTRFLQSGSRLANALVCRLAEHRVTELDGELKADVARSF